MATKTITIDTGEWVYTDSSGIPHTVTNAETFTFTLTDYGTTNVKWALNPGQVVATNDGLRLYMHDDSNNGFLSMADASDAAEATNIGDWVIKDPLTHKLERWKCVSATVDDVDSPSSITATFEQVDNTARTFTWTSVDIA